MPSHQSNKSVNDRVRAQAETVPPAATSNGILAALSKPILRQLEGKLRPVPLEIGKILYEPDETIEQVYFVTEGIISLLATLEDGASVEAGVIGPEGMLGIPIVLSAKSSPHLALVQGSGHAMKMTARDLRDAIKKDGVFLDLLLRYINAMFVQVAQTAACNRLHTVEERLARWLLLTHDRVKHDEFILTQEFISRMLGVRRAGVNVSANSLRQDGLIDYRRGKVTILNRKGLERASCECYVTVKQEYDRYLPH